MTASLLLAALTAVAASGALILSEFGRRRSVARAVVCLAGAVYRARCEEFRGELAALQVVPSESGLEYALGTVLAALVERLTICRRAVPVDVGRGCTALGATVQLNVPGGSIMALVAGDDRRGSIISRYVVGIRASEAGCVLVGEPTGLTAEDESGVEIVRRDHRLFGHLTVAQNIFLGRRSGPWLVSNRHEHAVASVALEKIGASIDTRTRIVDLSRSERVLVALARAVQGDCEVLVLDDPSANLSESGARLLVEALQLIRRRGISIVIVSHRLDDIFELADRVAVVKSGRLVYESPISETGPDELVGHIARSEHAVSLA